MSIASSPDSGSECPRADDIPPELSQPKTTRAGRGAHAARITLRGVASRRGATRWRGGIRGGPRGGPGCKGPRVLGRQRIGRIFLVLDPTVIVAVN
jgi:hypothetical protein